MNKSSLFENLNSSLKLQCKGITSFEHVDQILIAVYGYWISKRQRPQLYLVNANSEYMIIKINTDYRNSYLLLASHDFR